MLYWNTTITGYPVVQYVNFTRPLSINRFWSYIWSGSVAAGYKYVKISPSKFFERGAFLAMESVNTTFGINPASKAKYRDFRVYGEQFIGPNQNIYANLITQLSSLGFGQANRTNSFTHAYTYADYFTLTAGFTCGGQLYQVTKNITGEYYLTDFRRL